MLYQLTGIINYLDREFQPLEPMLSGFRLKQGGASIDSIVACESRLDLSIPVSFRKYISKFDFGNFTLGPVVFCATGDYLHEVLVYNEVVGWWGDCERPKNLIMIANSDPFVILLSCEKGEVFASNSSEQGDEKHIIASDFDRFIRGVGTVLIERGGASDREELAKCIHSEVGSEYLSYWLELSA